MKRSAPCRFIAIFAIFCLGNMAAGKGRNSRADDPTLTDLQNVIQQQASFIQQLSTDFQVLQAKVTAIENAAAVRDAQLQTLSNKVAFTAYFTHGDSINIGQSAPINYNYVALNVGNGYSASTGIFTAPVSGIYLFLVHIKTTMGADYEVNVDIVKSHTVIGSLSVATRDHSSDKSSISITAHVTKGEPVFTKHGGFDTILDQWKDTSFTGVLLYAD